jgi:hypothetical protein
MKERVMYQRALFLLVLVEASLACGLSPTPTDTPIPPPPAETATPTVLAGNEILGQWEAIDIVDGSNMTLNIERDISGALVFELYDDGATTCGGTPLYEFDSSGNVAHTGGNTYNFSGSGECAVTGAIIDFNIDMAYDAALDQLAEFGGQVWTR